MNRYRRLFGGRVSHILENTAVIMIICVALLIFFTSFRHVPILDRLILEYLEMNYALQRITAVMLLVIVWNLYKRKRTAWFLSVLLLSISLAGHLLGRKLPVSILTILMELIILAILLAGRKDFMRPSDRLSVRKGLLLAGISLILVLFNASLGFFHMYFHERLPVSFWGCVVNTFEALLLQESGGIQFSRFIFWSSWICIGGCILLILKPLIYDPAQDREDKQHVRSLVLRYGQNPGSYLSLEDDKLWYFGRNADGVIAYGIVGDTAVVNGDPVCSEEDFPSILAEFKEFCLSRGYHMIFLSITEKFRSVYELLGFGLIKCGEEARFELAEYNLKGGKVGKVRASINHAAKAGVTVEEYRPLTEKNAETEREILEVSGEWQKLKGGSELKFTIGGIGLEDPMDRRYFIARDENGEAAAFLVLLPFLGGDGYLADVTRHRKAAPGGVMEKLIYDTFMILRDEGVRYGSLGLSPLANLGEEGEMNTPAGKFLKFIYENMNGLYGFKDLYRVKARYNPLWQPSWFAYYPKRITPQMAYAVVRIQSPMGPGDYLRERFGRRKGSGFKGKDGNRE